MCNRNRQKTLEQHNKCNDCVMYNNNETLNLNELSTQKADN